MALASVCPGGAEAPQGRVSSVASLEAACARGREQPREPRMRPRGGRSRQDFLSGPSRPLAGQRKGQAGSRHGPHWQCQLWIQLPPDWKALLCPAQHVGRTWLVNEGCREI